MTGPQNCFSRSSRLTRRKEFLNFFKKPRTFSWGPLRIFQIPSPAGRARLGITFKTRLTSVMRNSIKRTIREYFRTHQQVLGPYDFNVIIQKWQNGQKNRSQEWGLVVRKAFEAGGAQ